MKEATGELNMTVITVVAIAAIAALFYTLIWPSIQTSIKNNTCSTFGNDYKYDKSKKQCCDSSNNCIELDTSSNTPNTTNTTNTTGTGGTK